MAVLKINLPAVVSSSSSNFSRSKLHAKPDFYLGLQG